MPRHKEIFKILIIDDHEVVRFGISQVIRQYLPFCQIFESNCIGSIPISNNNIPYNLIISDLNLPDLKFYQVTDFIIDKFPETPIIIFSMYEKESVTNIANDARIYQFIHKGEGLFALKDAVINLYNGANNNRNRTNFRNKDKNFGMLSPRELEIAVHLISGKTGVEIQETMNLKASTISTLKHRIFNKLDIQSVAELMKLSLVYGIDKI